MTALPDFGDAICYYRYYRAPDELEPQEPQERSSDVGNLLPGLAILQKSWEQRWKRQKSYPFASALRLVLLFAGFSHCPNFNLNNGFERSFTRVLGILHP